MRRRRLGRIAAGLTVVVGMAGAVGWVVLGTSLFDIRSVEVLGAREVGTDEVTAAADVTVGQSLLVLDTERVHASVAALPRVASVEVSRTLDGSVRIAITERTPVAVQPTPEGMLLVDATGTGYAAVTDPPPGLPELRMGGVRTVGGEPADPATLAAIAVLGDLPRSLGGQVRAVSADSPTDVVLRLGDGREVQWGGVHGGDRKAAVLVPLLTQPGQVYDVSSPDLPTVSG